MSRTRVGGTITLRREEEGHCTLLLETEEWTQALGMCDEHNERHGVEAIFKQKAGYLADVLRALLELAEDPRKEEEAKPCEPPPSF